MKKINALLLAGVMAGTLLTAAAQAEDETLSNSASNTPVEAGPFTTKYPVASQIVTAPFRVVTTAASGTIGLVGGTFKGIGTGVQDSFGYADEFGPEGDDTLHKGARGLLYFPTAGVSTLYYVPKNVATEAGKNAWDFGNRGYQWWNRL